MPWPGKTILHQCCKVYREGRTWVSNSLETWLSYKRKRYQIWGPGWENKNPTTPFLSSLINKLCKLTSVIAKILWRTSSTHCCILTANTGLYKSGTPRGIHLTLPPWRNPGWRRSNGLPVDPHVFSTFCLILPPPWPSAIFLPVSISLPHTF